MNSASFISSHVRGDVEARTLSSLDSGVCRLSSGLQTRYNSTSATNRNNRVIKPFRAINTNNYRVLNIYLGNNILKSITIVTIRKINETQKKLIQKNANRDNRLRISNSIRSQSPIGKHTFTSKIQLLLIFFVVWKIIFDVLLYRINC